LDDGSWRVRLCAAGSLYDAKLFRDPQVLERVRQHLDDPSPEVVAHLNRLGVH